MKFMRINNSRCIYKETGCVERGYGNAGISMRLVVYVRLYLHISKYVCVHNLFALSILLNYFTVYFIKFFVFNLVRMRASN